MAKRRRTQARQRYSSSHVFQLLVGHDFFNDAFGTDLDAMREAWPILRERVYELMHERCRAAGRDDGRIPWAAKKFDGKSRTRGKVK